MSWLRSLSSLLFPRCCVVCDAPLVKGEEYLCLRCYMELPRTGFHCWDENPVEQLFWGRIPLVHATSWMFYHRGNDFRLILHTLKYKGCKELGEVMGRVLAGELLPADFFRGVDVIVPIPLHVKKKKLRGYNQSEWIARGVSAVTGIPMDADSVTRERNTETQTHKSIFERWENVEGTFVLHHPELFAGKHILLVDDVLTTGATTVACASAFDEVKGVRFSVLTLALAGQ